MPKSSGGAHWVDPLLRPVATATLSQSGEDVVVRPTEQERAALAKALDLNDVSELKAEYEVGRRAGGIIAVNGRIRARVRPICIISLEPFDLSIDEPVAVRFIEEDAARRRQAEIDLGASADDPPDPVENGVIDLGRVTTEFLSLAIPAFPRKPGAEIVEKLEPDAKESPFAALKALAPKPKG